MMKSVTKSTDNIDTVLSYWFGELRDGWTVEKRHRLWFAADKTDDNDIRERFNDLINAAVAGRLDDWRKSDRGNMALIILSDQMTRATRRGTAAAFAGDAIALATCQDGIHDGLDKRLPFAYRCFYYLPLEHSESINDQQQCIRMFEKLHDDFPQYKKITEESIHYAVMHLRIIRKFGRFPHRNTILGRTSTPGEIEYLKNNGNAFNQTKK